MKRKKMSEHSECCESTTDDFINDVLKLKSKVNKTDKNWNTALHLTARDNKYDASVIKKLLRLGAIPKLINFKGETPLHCAIKANRSLDVIVAILRGLRKATPPDCPKFPLHFALQQPVINSKILAVLLEHFPSHVNQQFSFRNSPLHIAASNPSVTVDIVNLLLSHGARANSYGFKSMTPLHIALQAQNVQLGIVRALLQSGAPVNGQTHKKNTGLMLAVQNPSVTPEVIIELLQSGADLFIPNELGDSVLTYIARNFDPHEAFAGISVVAKQAVLWNCSFGSTQISHFEVYLAKLEEELCRIKADLLKLRKDLRDSIKCLIESGYVDSHLSCDYMAEFDPKCWKEMLRMLFSDAYPHFSDVIYRKIPQEYLLKMFREQSVYARVMSVRPDNVDTVQMIPVPSTALTLVAKYLNKEDAFNFLNTFLLHRNKESYTD